MTTRGEAQAQLDDFIERTESLTVTQFTASSADRFGNAIADILAANVFPRIEAFSDLEGVGEEAVALAHAMYEIANQASGLVQLAVTTSTELGGDDLRVGDRLTYQAFVAAEQSRVDALPELDEETEAILADADAMAAIEEAENEEVTG
jgi:hypothetical protein